MSRQIAVIVVIFVCTTVAWSILGTTVFNRTYSSDESLKNRVASIWGAPHVQKPPTATSTKEVVRKVEVSENGKNVIRTEKGYVVKPLALDGSKLTVGLDLEHRQKGLLWYSTYKVAFAGYYMLKNATDEDAPLYIGQECAIIAFVPGAPACGQQPYALRRQPMTFGLKFSQEF